MSIFKFSNLFCYKDNLDTIFYNNEQGSGVAGGSTDSTTTDDRCHEVLDIATVLAGVTEDFNYTTDVLYASPIDAEAFSSQLLELQTSYDLNNAPVSGLIEEVDGNLASTESEQFYTGTDASTNISNVSAISTTFDSVNSSLSEIDNADVSSIISQYNSNLKDFKSCARLKFLKQVADEYNNTWHADKVKTITNSQVGTVGTTYTFSDIHWVRGQDQHFPYWKCVSVNKSENYHLEQGEEYYDPDTYTYEENDYIDYWCYFTGDSWPWNWCDDDADELEAKIVAKGLPLPYDRSKIVDCD